MHYVRFLYSKYLVVFYCFNLSLSYITAQEKNQKPNIVIILADDLGWKDLSCYGSSFYETPNLDKLAAAGTRFTQNYAASPVCSPTRASLMTGKYPTKTGITDWIKGRQEGGKATSFEKLIAYPTAYQLALEENTIAEYALANGYQTFFAGKWHLGEEEKFWPQAQGFLTNKGGWSKGSPTGKMNDSTGGFFTPYQNPTLTDGPKGEYLTDRLTNECLAFIDKNKNTPFLLVHSLYAVHNPLQAPENLIKKYRSKRDQLNSNETSRFIKNEPWMQYEKEWKTRIIQDNPVYAAMVENMDWNIGRMINKLEEGGLLDNTLILFTSDNGGLSTAEGSPTSNLPLKAGKGWLYEGGIRVPLILYWKGKTIAGTISDLPISTIDIFPTVANAINNDYRKSATIDGSDIFQMLMKRDKYQKRNLIWHYPHYSNQGGRPGAAIRSGNYKLIYNFEDETVELYNILLDIVEQKNITHQYPKITKHLKRKLISWLKKNNGIQLVANPGYNKIK